MAFRKFSQPTPMRAAKFEGMPNLINAINTNQILKARKDQSTAKAAAEKQKRLAALKYSNPNGQIPQDFVENGKRGMAIINRAKKGEDVSEDMDAQVNRTNQSIADSQMRAQKLERIKNRAANDEYYQPAGDIAKVNNFYTQDFDVRQEQGDDSYEIFGDETFNRIGWKANFIKQREVTLGDKFTDAKGNVRDNEFTGAYIDKTGKVTVTIPDAQEYLYSRPEVKKYFAGLVNWKIKEEALSMMNTNIPEFAWTKGMNLYEVADYLTNNPKENFFNKRTFAERELIRAQADLKEGVKVDKNFNSKLAAENLKGGDKDLSVSERVATKNVESALHVVKKILFEEDQAALNTLFSQSEYYRNPRFSYQPDDVDGPPPKDAPNQFILIDVYDKENKKRDTLEIPFSTKEEKIAASSILAGIKNEANVTTRNAINMDEFAIAVENDKIFHPTTPGFDPKTLNN